MGYPHKEKQCGECQQVKPVEEFYPGKGRNARDGYCKNCRRIRDRARFDQRNKRMLANKAIDPFFYRRRKLVTLYGITHEQYLAIHTQQGGVCAICRKPEKRVLYGNVAHLVVDHDHKTGRLRALLCHRCNTALGHIEDSDFLSKALQYLAWFKDNPEWSVVDAINE